MIHIIALVIYVFIMIGVVLCSRKKVKGISDFFLGGRAVNPWMSAFSYGTAYFSAVLFIGYAGKIGWGFGLSTLWIVIGNAFIGSFLAWEILGKRTREMTQRLQASTMPEFLEVRYQSKALKAVTSMIIFLFLIPYSASVYKGLGYLFEEIFGIPTVVALLMMTVLTGIYLFFGGFIAATLADFIQGLIMIAGILLMLFFVMKDPTIGSIHHVFYQLNEINPSLVRPIGPPGLIPIASLVILTSLGSWGLPQMVHKFYTIKDEKSITCAKWVSTGFALLITFGAYFMGILGRLFFPDQMPLYKGIPTPDLIIPQMIARTLPDWVSAIILILVLSASMSTLASIVLASSSALVLDLLKGTFFPNLSQKRVMLLMRKSCLIFVVLSFILAISPNHILSLAALSWGAVSGSLFAPYLLGLYWERTTKQGVWAGIITALTIVIGSAILTNMNEVLIPVFSSAAMIIPFFVVIAVSFVTEKFEKKHLEYIYNVNH